MFIIKIEDINGTHTHIFTRSFPENTLTPLLRYFTFSLCFVFLVIIYSLVNLFIKNIINCVWIYPIHKAYLVNSLFLI